MKIFGDKVRYSYALLLILIPPYLGFAQSLHIIPQKTITIADPANAKMSKYGAISVNTQKEIYITDIALNRVLRLDADGTLLRETGGFGWEAEQFDRPVDIWAQNVLDVLVVDYNNHRIQRFDRNLNFVSVLANDASRDARLQFAYPVAVAFSAFGELFIAEQEHNRILKFDAGGQPVLSFGDYDWGAGSLQEPVDLTISAKNELFVADAGRRAVVKFDYFGNFLQEMRHDAFAYIEGLAVAEGHLFVLNATSLPRLLVLTLTGEPVAEFDLNNVLKSKAARAGNMAIMGKSLYVLDSASSLIHVFEIKRSSK
ncbi:MAG: NHL repeat-containing protein [Deferribacteres bacterium]|nr:NHL repeat-containing protein [candidate division KSB1 bacterium]MCB9511658.1 NHL repeat-containing protein [Deferribacteres bacterium]